MKALEFTIELSEIEPKIARRFVVPAGIVFAQFHNVIQVVMGWKDYHLYAFNFKDKGIEVTNDYESVEEYDYLQTKEAQKQMKEVLKHNPSALFPKFDNKKMLAYKTKISDYVTENKEFEYIYDFGDYWRHQLKLVKTHDNYTGTIPEVLDGQGKCPREDSGGVRDYYTVPKNNIYDVLAVNRRLEKMNM